MTPKPIGLKRVAGSLFADVSSISKFLKIWLEHDLLPEKEQDILKRYYLHYHQRFTDRMQHYYEDQTRELMELIRAQDSPRVLEIGCGCGTESLWMALHGAKVHGIDIKGDRLRVAECRQRVMESDIERELACRFERVSLLELDDGLTYDILWLEQSFHHLEPRNEVVEQMSRLLRPGGYAVISEANALNPVLQAQLIAKRGFTVIKTHKDELGRSHPYGNERVISGGSLRRQLEKVGVKSLSVRHFRLFPHHTCFDAWAPIERRVPKWFFPVFTHYNYVGQKAATGEMARG